MSQQQQDEQAPEFYQRFAERFPEIAKSYEALGKHVHDQGPLDEKTRALIKLAISGSTGMDSAFRTHIRKARKLGITRAEMEHVALLFLPTMGFPATMKAIYQIEKHLK